MNTYKPTNYIIKKYNISRQVLRRWEKAGKVQAINIENRWFFDEKSVIKYAYPEGYTNLPEMVKNWEGISYVGVRRLVNELELKTIYRNKKMHIRSEDIERLKARAEKAINFKLKKS
jgi:predicted site-specific integrase-resolvase